MTVREIQRFLEEQYQVEVSTLRSMPERAKRL
jgi:hypothetical protein